LPMTFVVVLLFAVSARVELQSAAEPKAATVDSPLFQDAAATLSEAMRTFCASAGIENLALARTYINGSSTNPAGPYFRRTFLRAFLTREGPALLDRSDNHYLEPVPY